MKKDNVIELSQPGEFKDQLTEIWEYCDIDRSI